MQGFSLSPYIFTLVLDVLTGHIQDVVPKCILFIDDIVLKRESQEDVNCKIGMCREVLQSKSFCLSRSKTEDMKCKFNKRQINNNLKVKIGEQIISNVSSFRYIESIVRNNGEIDSDVTHMIQARWMK